MIKCHKQSFVSVIFNSASCTGSSSYVLNVEYFIYKETYSKEKVQYFPLNDK